MVDFEGAVKTLDKVGYKAFLSVELEAYMEEPEKAALERIQCFDGLLDRIGLKWSDMVWRYLIIGRRSNALGILFCSI
jgi:hypothetical protein